MDLACVTGQGRGATDRLLAAVADRLARDGVRIVGALRPVSPDPGADHCDSDLWLLPAGPLVRITQDLGAGSTACRMDAGVFEEAVALAASRLHSKRVDLVVLNKFGLSESEGRGFRALIADALGKGVPVLTGVSETHRAAFDDFAGGLAARLPPEEDAVLDWCRAAVAGATLSKSGTYASPPCMAAEIDPAYFDPLGAEPEQARDVARWRRAERKRLAGLRDILGQAGRAQVSDQIGQHLRGVLAARGVGRGVVLSGYWPIKGEPDLRPILSELHRSGVTIALPIVETRAAPLIFRRWTPETRMLRGDWNIPVPPPEAEALVPDVTLAPCLGWDGGCFRLGWGGGYFDRTLTALTPRPFAIGIALAAARLPTIYPQPHDIPLDLIVTEDGISCERTTLP